MSTRLSSFPSTLVALARSVRTAIREERSRGRLRAAFPTVHFEWPINVIIDDDVSALSFGDGCFVGPYSEIVVLRQSPCSRIPGALSVGRNVRIGMGANIRAAGGAITIGDNTQIGQHVSLIASNHLVDKDTATVHADRWDEHKTGVTIGADCWIGAGAIILPGVSIGRGAVIAAGSVVTKSVGEKQLWRGNPARPASAPSPS